jgi:hypothetical protein
MYSPDQKRIKKKKKKMKNQIELLIRKKDRSVQHYETKRNDWKL